VTVSIQTSIDKQHPTKLHGYAGRAVAFWFLVATTSCLLVGTVIFYKSPPASTVEVGAVAPGAEVKDDLEKGEGTKEAESQAPTPQPPE
jgi:Na+/H+-dicarboxylate symporter